MNKFNIFSENFSIRKIVISSIVLTIAFFFAACYVLIGITVWNLGEEISEVGLKTVLERIWHHTRNSD